MTHRSTSPILRPATPFDHPRLASIWHGAAAHAQAPELPDVAALARRLKMMDGREWQITVAEQAVQVVGVQVVGFMALDLRQATLAEIFVAPDHIGTGVGRLLLDRAKARMPHGFTLRTWADNDRAQAFYLKSGLIQTHEAPHPVSGHPMVYFRWGDI